MQTRAEQHMRIAWRLSAALLPCIPALGCSPTGDSDVADAGAADAGAAGTGSGGTGLGTNSATVTGGSSSMGSLTGTSTAGATATGAAITTNTTSGGNGSDGLFSIEASLNPNIATVGIVTWTLGVPVDSGYLEFGRQAGNYEYQAPLDPAALGQQRTLMLGMKEGQTYHGRLVVVSGGTSHESQVFSVETGFLPNELPRLQVEDVDATGLYGGFTITCNGFTNAAAALGGQGTPTSTFAFIFDKDGDMVWAYDISDTAVTTCSSARFSFDGKHIWIGNFSNVSDDGALLRMTPDAESTRVYELPGRHHHFAVLPNDKVLYFEQLNGGGCNDGASCNGSPATGAAEGADLVMELDPETGATTELYDQNQHFQQQISESGAHTNYISYVPHLSAVSFSMRHTNTIALLSYPQTQLLAVFGGPADVNTFEIDWNVQHGHHFFDDRVLIFNNNGSSGNSDILEYQYDVAASSASLVETYPGDHTSVAFGDVQRLANGNLFVTYSTAGTFRELSPSGQVLRETVVDDAVGYAVHQKSLYGSPPPFAE